MSKIIRKKISGELSNRCKGQDTFLLIDYKGLKGNQAVELRRELRQDNIRMNVVKNSVAAHTFSGLGLTQVEKYMTGMTALVYGKDPVALAKRIVGYKDKNKVLDVKCGYMDGKVISPADVKKLSEIPSREQLLGQMVGVLAAPMTNLVRCINGIATKLVYVLNAVKDKKEKEDSK